MQDSHPSTLQSPVAHTYFFRLRMLRKKNALQPLQGIQSNINERKKTDAQHS